MGSDNLLSPINDKALLKVSKEFAARVKKKKWGKDGFLKWDRPCLAKKVISVSIPGPPVSSLPEPLSPAPMSPVTLSPLPLHPLHVSPVLLSPVPMSPVTQSSVPLAQVPLAQVPLAQVPLSSVPTSSVPVSPSLSAAEILPADTFNSKFIEI